MKMQIASHDTVTFTVSWDSLPPPPEAPAHWLHIYRNNSSQKIKYVGPLVSIETYPDKYRHFDEWRIYLNRVERYDGLNYKDRCLMRGSKGVMYDKYNRSTSNGSEVCFAHRVGFRYLRRKCRSPAMLIPSEKGENPVVETINQVSRAMRERYSGHLNTWTAFFDEGKWLDAIDPEFSKKFYETYDYDPLGFRCSLSRLEARGLCPNVLIEGRLYRVEKKTSLKVLRQLSKCLDKIEEQTNGNTTHHH